MQGLWLLNVVMQFGEGWGGSERYRQSCSFLLQSTVVGSPTPHLTHQP